MKKIIEYTTYEGSTVELKFYGSDIDSIECQENETDEFYKERYGIGGYRKNIITDETSIV